MRAADAQALLVFFLLQAALRFGTSGGWRKATLVPAVIWPRS
jgi:hypothetical protein